MFDLLPTFARLAGGRVPTDRVIDGKDIWPLISGQPGAKSPHEAFFFYSSRRLEAVRSGKWKLHLPHEYRSLEESGTGGQPGRYVQRRIGQALFDLERDIGEQHDVSANHPEIVKRLADMAREFERDLRANARPPGRVQ